MGMQQSHSITLRTKGSGSLLSLTWDSNKSNKATSSILVNDILDVSVDSKKGGKHDRGKFFTIHAEGRDLHLVASSAKEAFWFIKGFHGLLEEVEDKRSSKKLKQFGNPRGDRESTFDRTLDSDLANELFADDFTESTPSSQDNQMSPSDLSAIIKNVELTGEVKLTRGLSLTKDQLGEVRGVFETRQGAASILQKIIRKMVGGGDDFLDFSPEELLSCFKIFDLDGEWESSESERARRLAATY